MTHFQRFRGIVLLMVSVALTQVTQPLPARSSQHLKTPPSANAALTEGAVRIFGIMARRDIPTEQRLASVLAKIGKNLVLEQTRGAKDIEVYRRAAPAVVLVATSDGVGSGAVLDREGHVLTNWHVAGDNPEVVVVFKPRDSAEIKKELAFRARVEKADSVSDLALLKIVAPTSTLSTLSLGNAATLAVGQDVHAIGHPEGEVWTYTKGVISQLRRNYTWAAEDGIQHRANIIQTQTPINPGNSGGPLLDDDARLIGINSFRASGEGLNYAVGLDTIQQFLRAEKTASPTRRPSSEAPKCPEIYATTSREWPKLLGCYAAASTPPPDMWIVYYASQSLAYAATSSASVGQIDTVVKSRGEQGVVYFIDRNCDGIIDLIGYQRKNSDRIDTFRQPSELLRLVDLAKDVDLAIKTKKIPYPQVRVCQ